MFRDAVRCVGTLVALTLTVTTQSVVAFPEFYAAQCSSCSTCKIQDFTEFLQMGVSGAAQTAELDATVLGSDRKPQCASNEMVLVWIDNTTWAQNSKCLVHGSLAYTRSIPEDVDAAVVCSRSNREHYRLWVQRTTDYDITIIGSGWAGTLAALMLTAPEIQRVNARVLWILGPSNSLSVSDLSTGTMNFPTAQVVKKAIDIARSVVSANPSFYERVKSVDMDEGIIYDAGIFLVPNRTIEDAVREKWYNTVFTEQNLDRVVDLVRRVSIETGFDLIEDNTMDNYDTSTPGKYYHWKTSTGTPMLSSKLLLDALIKRANVDVVCSNCTVSVFSYTFGSDISGIETLEDVEDFLDAGSVSLTNNITYQNHSNSTNYVSVSSKTVIMATGGMNLNLNDETNPWYGSDFTAKHYETTTNNNGFSPFKLPVHGTIIPYLYSWLVERPSLEQCYNSQRLISYG